MGQTTPFLQDEFIRQTNVFPMQERFKQSKGVPIDQPKIEGDSLLRLKEKILRLELRINRLETSVSGVVHISRLPNYNLNTAIDVIVEPDDEGFIARSVDLPLYSYSDDSLEAIESLKYEIETLYDDLKEDDNFTSEWLRIKDYLFSRIED
jgi:hypothetical protein